ncbi:lymphokine-activated killer T-cell-originated protein kinase homolog [Malaya genurostris]|uniref:lymphokine-activated killer T-cell-originated protein kinase homolog n=1 Tax=Malaya genurostris TaxID=325434 RepID=UPI0026F39998|nr:lymphokine-activated killer T-cell-originated protein kinase homolog [Malaya genurostris]
METPLKSKILAKLLQNDGLQTPVASHSIGSTDRQARHITSITRLPSSPFLKKLGFGTGVEVLRIKRSPTKNSNKSPWAIKMLSRRSTPEKAKLFGDRLTEEANILRSLNHPNIVGYRGFDSLEAGKEYIAMEYCNTSLGDMLQERYDEGLGPLDAQKIQRMALDTLNALDYLHTVALILHGDLKSFNILVKNDFEVCKLCDFGVSLPLNKEGYLDTDKKKDAQYVGTGIWSAPEVLEEDVSLISSKADIFSFGLVIYETIALLPPHTFPGMKDESIASSADYAVMKSIIHGKPGNPVNRKLDVSEVIVLDDESEQERSMSEVNEPVRKRKLSREEENEPQPPKKVSSEPDSTTDTTIISIADDSLQQGDKSVITVEDDDDEDDDGVEDEDDDLGEEEEDLEEDEEGDYLDYGCLGTRPAIPEGLNLPEDYNFILEVFYVCTQEDYEARPSAKTLLAAWQKKTDGSSAGSNGDIPAETTEPTEDNP